MQGRQGGCAGGRGTFLEKGPPSPRTPNPSKNFYSGRYGRSPSGGHRAWHRALPSGEALGTRWHLSRRPARTQWPGLWKKIRQGCRAALWGARLCVWGWLWSVPRSLFHGSFPKKQKSLCSCRDTGRESAFGEGRGEFEGGREPSLCASQRGSLPPSTKSLLQSLTRYRGAQAGRPATRSASAGRKGRSRAWEGVTQRSS